MIAAPCFCKPLPPPMPAEDIATAGAAAAPVQCGKGAELPSDHIISNGNHIM